MSEPSTFNNTMAFLRNTACVQNLSPAEVSDLLRHNVTQTMIQEPFHIRYNHQKDYITFTIENSQKHTLVVVPYRYSKEETAKKAAWRIRLRLLYLHRKSFG